MMSHYVYMGGASFAFALALCNMVLTNHFGAAISLIACVIFLITAKIAEENGR